MFLKLRNVTIDQCGTGIKSSGPLVLDADGLTITNTARAMDLTKPTEEKSPREAKIKCDIAVGVAVALIAGAAASVGEYLWKLLA
jgi:hypothetical protein